MDAQDKRIEAIIGDMEGKDSSEALESFYNHLCRSLQLPCDVTGYEDFRWEERYVIGGRDPKEYEQLKKKQPSYSDRYELLGLDKDGTSEWMMFDEDIVAHVKRKSDGKEFWLGLAELEALDKKSPNGQLLNDYGVYLVNNR